MVDFVQWCMCDGVQALTVYAFSTENWRRDASEVAALMAVFAQYTGTLRHEAVAKNIRVRVVSTGEGLNELGDVCVSIPMC